MNQYIITEDDICTIRDYVLGAFYEGENKEKIYDLLKSLFSVIRSRPYPPSERDIPECKITEGAHLKLCECGNDTFRCIETADWIVEIEQWEGDDLLKICTKCGKDIGCFSDAKRGKSISRKTLAELRQQAGDR